MKLTNTTKITVKGFITWNSTKYYAILVDYKYWLCNDNGFMRLSTKKANCRKFDSIQDATALANSLKIHIAYSTNECGMEESIFEPSLHIPIY